MFSQKCSHSVLILLIGILLIQDHPQPPPVTPALKEERSLVVMPQGYQFTLREGALPNPPTMDPEYAAFRQRYLLNWGPIITMLGRLQRLLCDYAVPVAIVNGERYRIVSYHM